MPILAKERFFSLHYNVFATGSPTAISLMYLRDLHGRPPPSTGNHSPLSRTYRSIPYRADVSIEVRFGTGSSRELSIALANPSGDLPGTMYPFTPQCTRKLDPLTFVVTTDRPQAMASTVAVDQPSVHVPRTNTRDLRSSLATPLGSRLPVIHTRSRKCALSIAVSRAGRSSPSPTNTSSASRTFLAT